MPVTFRDCLAVLLVCAIIAFWVLQGIGLIKQVPGEVNGALIAVFTLVAQYYFRQRTREEAEAEREG